MYAKLRIMIRHKRGASAERYVLRGVPMVLHKIHSVKLETLEKGRERKRNSSISKKILIVGEFVGTNGVAFKISSVVHKATPALMLIIICLSRNIEKEREEKKGKKTRRSMILDDRRGERDHRRAGS